MNCDRYQESLSQWMDGELLPAVEAGLFMHLSQCESCRIFFKDLFMLNQEFASARPVQVPASLDQRVLTMVPSTASMRRFPWFSSKRMYSARAVGLAVLASIVTTIFVSSQWFQHSQPQQTIVCLTPLPEVEVTGYVVVASSHTKGMNQ